MKSTDNTADQLKPNRTIKDHLWSAASGIGLGIGFAGVVGVVTVAAVSGAIIPAAIGLAAVAGGSAVACKSLDKVKDISLFTTISSFVAGAVLTAGMGAKMMTEHDTTPQPTEEPTSSTIGVNSTPSSLSTLTAQTDFATVAHDNATTSQQAQKKNKPVVTAAPSRG
jgi:glycerol uptake facilitator-like aquaporin